MASASGPSDSAAPTSTTSTTSRFDKQGNIYATGVFRLTGTFGDVELKSSGGADAYLFSVDASGKERWVKKLDGEKDDWGRTLAIADDGSLYWLVEFSRKATIGRVTLESVGNRDWGVIKMSASGEAVWGVSFGTLLDDLAYSLTIDPAGDLVIAGAFEETLKIGKSELKAAGNSDAFVAKLDGRNGAVLWAKSWGDKREDIATSAAVDKFGNIAVTGIYWNTVDFGGGPLKSNGEKDLFVVKLSPAGDHLWSKNFGGEQVDYGRAVMFDATDNRARHRHLLPHRQLRRRRSQGRVRGLDPDRRPVHRRAWSLAC